MIPRTKMPIVETYSKMIDFTLSLNLDNSFNFESIGQYCVNNSNLNNDNNDIETFINKIIQSDSSFQNESFIFSRSFYLEMSLIDKLMNKLERLFSDSNNKINNNYIYKVNIIDYVNSSDYKLNQSYTFHIKNKNEFDYAKKLFILYKNYIKPYFVKSNRRIENISNNFNRPFMLLSNLLLFFLIFNF